MPDSPARCPFCSRKVEGMEPGVFRDLTTRSGSSVWFFWMNFQSDQPDKPDRRDRPDEPAVARCAQYGQPGPLRLKEVKRIGTPSLCGCTQDRPSSQMNQYALQDGCGSGGSADSDRACCAISSVSGVIRPTSRRMATSMSLRTFTPERARAMIQSTVMMSGMAAPMT